MNQPQRCLPPLWLSAIPIPQARLAARERTSYVECHNATVTMPSIEVGIDVTSLSRRVLSLYDDLPSRGKRGHTPPGNAAACE